MDNTKTNNELVNYKKSNFMIGAKYKSTLLENKLLALSLTKIQDAYEDKEGSLTVKIPGKEVRKIFDTNSGSFYDKLESAADSLMNRKLGMSDPDTQEFQFMAVVINSQYKDGILSIEYNKNMKAFLKDLKDNYTRLSFETMLKFKSVYSFRLYELLKSEMYTPKGVINKSGEYRIEKGLSELKFELGVVNTTDRKVADYLRNKTNPDYDEAIKLTEKKLYDKWSEFKRVALDTAVDEINEKTDVELSYETVNGGRGGKVMSLIFFAKYKDVIDKEFVDGKQVDMDDLIDDVLAITEGKVKIRDARTLLSVAGNDIHEIQRVYDLAKTKNLDNLVGFMISAIKNGYKDTPSFKSKHVNNITDFHKFEQKDYDFDKMEEQLLKH